MIMVNAGVIPHQVWGKAVDVYRNRKGANRRVPWSHRSDNSTPCLMSHSSRHIDHFNSNIIGLLLYSTVQSWGRRSTYLLLWGKEIHITALKAFKEKVFINGLREVSFITSTNSGKVYYYNTHTGKTVLGGYLCSDLAQPSLVHIKNILSSFHINLINVP